MVGPALWGTEARTPNQSSQFRTQNAGLLSASLPPYNSPMAVETLTIERLSAQEGPRVIWLRGPLTLENVPLFQNAIRREENFPVVIVDLTEVPYIDSMGMGFIVGLYTSVVRGSNGGFVLVGAVPLVHQVLDLTRLSSIIPMAPDMESGMAALCERNPRPRGVGINARAG